MLHGCAGRWTGKQQPQIRPHLVELLHLLCICEESHVGHDLEEGLVLGVVPNQDRERFVGQGLALVPLDAFTHTAAPHTVQGESRD